MRDESRINRAKLICNHVNLSLKNQEETNKKFVIPLLGLTLKEKRNFFVISGIFCNVAPLSLLSFRPTSSRPAAHEVRDLFVPSPAPPLHNLYLSTAHTFLIACYALELRAHFLGSPLSNTRLP